MAGDEALGSYVRLPVKCCRCRTFIGWKHVGLEISEERLSSIRAEVTMACCAACMDEKNRKGGGR